MAKKLYSSGNYIIVDYDNGTVERYPKAFTVIEKESTTVSIQNTLKDQSVGIPDSEAANWDNSAGGGTPYSAATLLTFLIENSGNFSNTPGAEGTSPGDIIISDGSKWETGSLPVSAGIWGISDATGKYTYYDTIALANAAAVSGDTIELFADVVETGAVEWALKSGVHYEMHGHTYTLNVASNQNAVTCGNLTASMSNGKIVRTGGVAGTSNSLALYSNSSGAVIKCSNVEFFSDYGRCLYYIGEISGATFRNTTYTSYIGQGAASTIITNCNFYSANGGGFYLNGIMSHCYTETNGNTAAGFFVAGKAYHSHFYSTGNVGGNFQGVCDISHCTFKSSSSYGGTTASTTSGIRNCSFFSSASYAFISGNPLVMINSSGESTANQGLYIGNAALTSYIYNCTSISSAAIGGLIRAVALNCVFRSTWDNAGGHAASVNGGAKIFNCSFEIKNTGAYYLDAPGACNISYGNNAFLGGAVTAFNPVITQVQTSTPDVFGNIESDGTQHGVFSITGSDGIPVYYDTIALANAAASSGDLIEMHADYTETGAVEFILKDGVNYNLNGHTYTLNNAGTSDAMTDNNVAVTCNIFNGKIVRTGGAASLTSAITLYIDNTSSEINLYDVIIENTVGLPIRNDGGIVRGGFYTGVWYSFATYGGTVENVNVYSSGAVSAMYVSSTNLYNSFSHSDGSTAIDAVGSSNLHNVNAYSSANNAIIFNSTGEISNCTGYSDGGNGIHVKSTARAMNCVGISSSTWALDLDNSSVSYNCTGYSTASYGGTVRSDAYNCTFESTAQDAVYLQGNMYNCSCVCSWNSASGDAIHAVTTNKEIFNCFLEVVNASAYCINAGAITIYYGQNTFKGATTAVNASITQGQTNTPDTHNNLVIG